MCLDLNETSNTYAYQGIIGQFRLTAERNKDSTAFGLLYGAKYKATWRCSLICSPAHLNRTISAMDLEMRDTFAAISCHNLDLVGAIVARTGACLQDPEDLF